MGLCHAWLRFKSFCSGAIIFLTFSLLSGTWRSIRASSPAAPSILPWPHKKKPKPVSPHAGKRWQKIRKASLQPRGSASDGKCFCACSRCTRPQKCKKLFCPALPTCGKMPFGGLGREKTALPMSGGQVLAHPMPVHTRFQTHPQTTTHIFACPFCGPRLPRDSNPSIHSSASPQPLRQCISELFRLTSPSTAP